MDSYFRECHPQVHFVSGSIETVPPRLPDRFQATFNFSCQHKYQNWVLRQDHYLEFLDEVEEPLVTKSIQYNPEKATHSKFEMGRSVFRGLQDFSLPPLARFELAKFLSDTTWGNIDDYMPQNGNNLNIDFSFAVVHKHIFDENPAINLVIQQSMQQPAMVPATDASIKSLKSRVIDSSDENHGSCRICLEDFEDGCQGVVMPCSHIFHTDCIEKWLKASHYCPLCRHEMPTY